jgi:Family of unknown function (DUF5767)
MPFDFYRYFFCVKAKNHFSLKVVEMEFSFDTGEGREMRMNDDEAAILDEISIIPPETRKVPLKPKPSRPSPFAKRAPGPVAPPPAPDEGLDMFMNPNKRTAPPVPPPEEFDGGEEGEEYEGEEGQPEGYQPTGGQVPSEGYKSIEDEKADLLNKITRLNKKGIQSSQRMTIYSDIEEIRTEYKRMTYGIEVERSIKFQRRMLIACVTGLEFLNDKFDPFDLELNGWSQNMMENVDDYDGVFEELYNKYKTKVQVAPEVKLIMMVGGSAMMFHLTNSMFKAAVPNVTQVMKQNPGLMQNMMDAVQRTQPVQQPGGPREMRGPGMDFGSLMNMMGPPPAQMTRPGRQAETESVSDIVSVDEGDPDTRQVNLEGEKKKRGPKSKKKEVSL